MTIASETNGQITLSGGQGCASQTVAPAAIVAIRDNAEESAYERLLHPGLLQLWTGHRHAFGLAGTAGNAVTSTFNTAINASRNTTHDAKLRSISTP